MEYNILLRIGRCALVETETQYIVACEYDETQPKGQQWGHGLYFTHWNKSDSEKAHSLYNAIEAFREKTEENYIPRYRLEELATLFKDGLIEDTEDIYGMYIKNGEFHFDLNHTIFEAVKEKTKTDINIIELTALEWKQIRDLLKDGCYIVVIVNSNKFDSFNAEETAYRNQLRQYHIMDAESQWEEYREANDVKDIDLDKSDYAALADAFENIHDCNIADNAQWQNIIADYLREKKSM